LTTVAEIAEEIAGEFGENYSGDSDIADQYDKWVIQAARYIFRSAPWFFANEQDTINLIAGTRVYALSSTVASVKVITYSGATNPITYAEADLIVEHNNDLYATGTPRHFYYEGLGSSQEVEIGLWPVPNAAFVTAQSTLTALVHNRPPSLNSGTTLDMPPEYVDLLHNYVRGMTKLTDGDTQTAQAMYAQFVQEVGVLNNRALSKRGSGSEMPAAAKKVTVAQAPESVGS